MFYTYILKSLKDHGYYYGHTKHLEIRLLQHNSSKVKSTKSRIPFIIFYFETFETKSEAYRQEMFWKTAEGKSSLKQKGIL